MSKISKNVTEIGERMRQVRHFFAETQRDFATRLGISLSHYSKLESGIGGIGEGLIQVIAKQAGCTPEWIRSGIGSPPQPENINPHATTTANHNQLPRLTLGSDLFEKALNLADKKELRTLAQEIAEQLGIPFNRALATLIAECLEKS